jgi:hypothetical protein
MDLAGRLGPGPRLLMGASVEQVIDSVLTGNLQVRFVPSEGTGGRVIVTEYGEQFRTLMAHGRRIWQWAAFDPPLRKPGYAGCCSRQVSCLNCGGALGTANDPIDALLMAWRHGRKARSDRR